MGSKLGGVTLWLVRIPQLLLARSHARKKRNTTDYLGSCTTNRVPSQCTSHSLTFSPSRRVTVSSLFSVFTFVKQMPWQLHSCTAFTTVSWFYVALTPRRQRKQKMKRMKPTMAITFHMRALRVAATSLNQKSDTFIPTEYAGHLFAIVVLLIVASCWLHNSLG